MSIHNTKGEHKRGNDANSKSTLADISTDRSPEHALEEWARNSKSHFNREAGRLERVVRVSGFNAEQAPVVREFMDTRSCHRFQRYTTASGRGVYYIAANLDSENIRDALAEHDWDSQPLAVCFRPEDSPAACSFYHGPRVGSRLRRRKANWKERVLAVAQRLIRVSPARIWAAAIRAVGAAVESVRLWVKGN